MITNSDIRETNAKTGTMGKWLLFTAFLISHFSFLISFSSCTREEDQQTAIEEYDPENAYGTHSESYWRRVHAAQRQEYIGDLYRSYGVGYGYNGTGKYSDYDEVRDRIIDLSYIQQYDRKHGSATIVDDVSPSSYHHVYSGTDAITICDKLTRKSSVKVDAILFQAEVSSTYNKTDMTSNEYAFCTIYDGLTLASRHLEPYDLYYIAREHPEALSPGFLRYQNLAAEAIKQNNQTEAMRIIQDMFQTYGTHIIYHASLGGKLKFSTTMNRHVVDSRTTLDEQASASFLYCIGTPEGTETQNWVVNTQTDRETHIEALGGNSALALKLSGLHDSDNNALKSQVVNEWFKSLKFTPGADKDEFATPHSDQGSENNVELVEIKVAPVADLILDHEVAALYNTLVGKHISYETNVMPRARNQVYAKIPVSTLRLTDRSVTSHVVAQHEIIGEVLNEYVHNTEYTVFYPTLGGKVCREGIGRRQSDDSLFTVTWQYLEGAESKAKAYVTPLVRTNYDDYIYYNNGDIDISPANDSIPYTSDVTVSRGALYMWNDTCVANMKIGPYYLHQGVMANTSKDESAMNTIRTLLKDVPVGYEVAHTVQLNQILDYMYNSGEVFAPERIKWNEVPSFFSFKRFILFDDFATPHSDQGSENANQYGIFNLQPHNTSVTPMALENIGQALLVRKRDFKHM